MIRSRAAALAAASAVPGGREGEVPRVRRLHARFVPAFAICAALSIATIACGSGDDDPEASPTAPRATSTRAASTPTQANTSTPVTEDTPAAAPPTQAPAAVPPTPILPTPVPPTPAPRVDAVSVTAGDFAFSPSAIAVNRANDTNITVTNSGVTPHTMNVYYDPGYTQAVPGAASAQLAGGGSDTFTLTSASIGGAAQLFFRCEIHPVQMQGTIAVQ